ncbi:MAG: hypothetical protein ACPGJS_16580 [Flammeovirgaceae bacterium]
MEITLKVLLFIHVLAGFIALLAGAIAVVTKKGGTAHRKWGMVYFWGMLVVFITAVILSTFKFIPFLFMIAFFSFYQVFSGYRILFLKQLYSDQKPKWIDWLSAGISLCSSILFMVWGGYHLVEHPASFFPKLAIGFGVGGILITYTNTKPFFIKPKNKQFWWFHHLNNMMGGLIATTTAFSTTIFGILEINSVFVWLWPTLIGVPLIRWWNRSYRKKFDRQLAVA